jgi:hypothetical protein
MKVIAALILGFFALSPLASAIAKEAKGKTTSMTFTVGSEVRIGIAGKKGGATLADLKIGDEVSITYQDTDGALVVSRLRAASAEEKPESERSARAKTEGDAKRERTDGALRARGKVTAIDPEAGTLTADVQPNRRKE